MAAACAEVIAAWYDDLCGDCVLPDGDPILRIGEDGDLEQLIDGEWSEPTGDYVIPPPEARTEPTPEERRCLAALNAANGLKLLYEEYTDVWGEHLGLAESIVDIAAFIIGFIAPPVGLTMKALALIAFGAWKIAFDTVEFVTADFWTSGFDDNIKCALLRSAIDTDGVVTFDWEMINNELINQIEWIDPTLGSYTLAGQVRWMLAQITEGGLNLLGATTAITEGDCDECADVHCKRIDFRLSDGTGEGFAIGGGTYSSGNGWVGNNYGENSYSDVFGTWTFPETIQVRGIEIGFTKTNGSGANNSNYLAVVNPSPPPPYNYADGYDPFGADIAKGSSTDYPGSGLYFDLNSGTATVSVTVHWMQVEYIGSIPEGWADDCE